MAKFLLNTQRAGPSAGPWGQVQWPAHLVPTLRASESSGTVTPDGQLERRTGPGRAAEVLHPPPLEGTQAGSRGWRRKDGDTDEGGRVWTKAWRAPGWWVRGRAWGAGGHGQFPDLPGSPEVTEIPHSGMKIMTMNTKKEKTTLKTIFI